MKYHTNEIFENRYFGSIRKEILDFIPDNFNNLLDIGCGYGMTAKYIKEVKKGFSIDGIEYDENAIQKAKLNLDEVYKVDLNKLENFNFINKKYDIILLLDILEHLVYPDKILVKLKKLINDNSVIIISVPNVRHFSVIYPLIFKNEWIYKDAGVLDRTHLRFFTEKSIKFLIESCGYKVEKLIRKYSTTRYFFRLNLLLLNLLKSFGIFQYILVCKINE